MGPLGLRGRLNASCAGAESLVSPKRAVVLALATTAALAAGTASASAVIVQRPNGHRISYQPTRRVARFAGKVEEATRTMKTEVDVPNPTLELVPGMYAEVDLITEERRNEAKPQSIFPCLTKLRARRASVASVKPPCPPW